MTDDSAPKVHWKVEQKELREENARLKAQLAGEAPPVTETVGAPTEVEGFSPEPVFIDRVLAEVAAGLDFRGGSMSNVIEKIYERVAYVRKTRRIIVDLAKRLGFDEEWPTLAAMGLSGSTGLPVVPKVKPAPSNAPAVVIDAPAMPTNSKPNAAAILAAFGNPKKGIAAEVSQRPEPARELATAAT